MRNKTKTEKRLLRGMIVVVVLTLCLCATTFALVRSSISVRYDRFQTGYVRINLNDGEPVIREYEFLFEPGMTVEKDFFIENQSTADVYYRLYFNNVDGGLADVLQISIRNDEKTLYQGSVMQLTRTAPAADDVLQINERRDLTISFTFPADAGNRAQNMTLTFDLCADAVQTKNNPNKLFE